MKFELGIGYLGNGATCWNSAIEEHGDYQTVAHISTAGNIKWYIPVEEIPGDALLRIEHIADCHKENLKHDLNVKINDLESFENAFWKIADQMTYNQTSDLLNRIDGCESLYDKKQILINAAINIL